MTDDINQLFNKTKGNLFYQKGAGFLGSLLCKVQFKWTTDIPTAAISPTELVWNPEFFLKLDKDSRVTVLAHELWHNGMMHGIRRGDRCPDIWNVAADHVINLLLKEHGYYMGGFPYIMDDHFKGWSTDEVYDELITNGGMPSNYDMAGDILKPGQGAGPEAQAKITAQAIADVVSAMTTSRMTNEAGVIPGETTQTLDWFLNPKLPWEVLLYNFFNALSNQEYSYQRPNRRYDDPLMPGNTGRNGLEHLIFAVDISGSITDEQILRMNSEVRHIQDNLEPEKLTLVTFDTEIRDVYEFDRGDSFEKITITGRGGTDLDDVYAYARKHGATALCVFTDLWVDIPEKPPFPVLWVCVDNSDAEVPYGQLVHFSESKGASFGTPTPDNFTWTEGGSGIGVS